MDKKISVIVPVYKVEKYLDKCIESIVNQTYKNLEIILVDDGSPDNCPQMCDDWAKKDGRIVVIHKQNGGVSTARNMGIDASNGDYITFVDADDFIDADMICSLADAMDDADMAICGFTFEYLDKPSQQINCDDAVFDQPLKSYIDDVIRPEACGKLIKKSVITDLKFDTSVGYGEDLLFNYWVIKNCQKVVTISKPAYHYLQDSGNSSTTAIITDARAQSYKVFDIIVQDNKDDADVYNSAIWRFTVATFAILSRVLMVKDFEQKYFAEICNALLKYKMQILKNKKIPTRHKLSVFVMCISKRLYKAICKVIK